MNLGQRLKALRLAAGFASQSDLARTAGVTQTNISEIERGTVTNPRMVTLEKLANALRVSVQELVSQKEGGAGQSFAWFWKSRFATMPVQELMAFRYSSVQERVHWAVTQFTEAFPIEEVAELLGVDKRWLTAIRQGQDANVDTVVGQLVDAAGLPFNWAVTGEPPAVDETARAVLTHPMGGSYLRVIQRAIELELLPDLLEQQVEMMGLIRGGK